jgi:arylsulfatase A-like enzyme
MTGKYPHSNGVLANCNSNGAKQGYELLQSDRCWSDLLKDQGYSLGYIGKWHLDSPREPWVKSPNNSATFAWNEWCPPGRRHGFDFWYAYGTYDNHFKPEYWTTDAPRDRRLKIEQWSPEHEADMAIAFIRNQGGTFRDPERPFALVVANNPPHMPYQLVPEKYIDLYRDKSVEELLNRPNVDLANDTKGARLARKQIRNYFAMVSGVDDQFGRILAALEDAGLARDTIVVFTSDHGDCLGCHEQVSKNVHYEESMRVPFLIRWPGRIDPSRDDLLLSSPDIYPTLLDLMGFAAQTPSAVEGTSRASILLRGQGERPTSQLYMWVPYGKPAWGRRGVRTHSFTLMLSKSEGKPTETVLHHNLDDPYQLENIAATEPQIVTDLIEGELNPWLKKTNDPWLHS